MAIVTRALRLLGAGALLGATAAGAVAAGAPMRPAGASFPAAALYTGNLNAFSLTAYGQPANGDQAPSSTLTSNPGPYGPQAEAFDASHDLWVLNAANDQLTEYLPGQLGATGAVVPHVTISSAGLSEPESLAFDGSGNLWVGEFSQIVEFSHAQLAGSGHLTPAVELDQNAGSIDGATGITFDGSADLWVSNNTNNTVVEFQAAQLASSGAPVPHVTVSANGTSLDGPRHLAFNGANLWVANYANNTVVEFLAAHIAATGSPAADVTLSATAGSLSAPYGLVFDGSGNLWVSNAGADGLVEFQAAQITTTGAPVPHVSLTPTGYAGPNDLAFDTGGNLWAPLAYADTVVELGSGQLTASGSPTPAVVLSATNPAPINNPYGVAVDGAGDLWEANFVGGTLAMFTPAQVAAGGAPVPSVVITGINNPTGLAFDRAGDLWVVDYSAGTLSELTPAQLATSGSPTPAVTLTTDGTSLGGPEELAIDAAGDVWVSASGTDRVEEFTPAQLAASGGPPPAVTAAWSRTTVPETVTRLPS